MIQFRDIEKTFLSTSGEVQALKQINVTIDDGDIFGFIGFSGAGKSTLLRMVNGLEIPTKGNVLVNGKEISSCSNMVLRSIRKQIGMVFQQFNLLETKTVFENVSIPMLLDKMPKAEIEKRVIKLLEYVELEDKIHSNASQLSGGQKQRVGIARALATNPSILLCDEATSALDPKTTTSILQLLKRINKEMGITILVITHEMNVIKEICNKVAVMEDGNIIEQGEVLSVFGNPQQQATKEFVKTVIDDRVPESICNSILEKKSNPFIIKMTFLGDTTHEAIFAQINKRFDVETNIIFASVSQLQNSVLGIFIVDLVGEKSSQALALDYCKEKEIKYERVRLE